MRYSLRTLIVFVAFVCIGFVIFRTTLSNRIEREQLRPYVADDWNLVGDGYYCQMRMVHKDNTAPIIGWPGQWPEKWPATQFPIMGSEGDKAREFFGEKK